VLEREAFTRWIRLAASHQCVITLEENAVAGGAGSAVSECLAAHGLQRAVHHIGIASLLADEVWWLDGGRLIGAGAAMRVLDPAALERTFGVPFGEHAGQVLPILPSASP